ncbi:hypothetical protein EIP91_009997 [Steccherinum ochraceum]|uniref:BTB domain-containing protein n=1 Tax=Steccherinum ochraceum TaxID=92696 RepID=A0A4R0RNP7_9APHY|nr:hypothetical protein EIP91_009997 [Steccherinum ochraceum]
MDDGRPAKRVKLEETPTELKTEPPPASVQGIPQGEPWLEDGNVILVAQDGTGFRVFQSVLSKNSAVFREMFAASRLPTSEVVEGCSVYRLSDTGSDLHHVLQALFDSGATKLPFSSVAAMLRIGSKYLIEHLREDAIQRLRENFPNQLSLDIKARLHGTFQNGVITDLSLQDSFTVVSLAWECNVPQLLPTAYYNLAQMSMDVLISGHVDSEGRIWELSKDDLKRIAKGQAHLRRSVAAQVKFVLFMETSSACLASGVDRPCWGIICGLRELCFSLINTCLGALNPWHIWIANQKLCADCTKHFSDQSVAERTKAWSMLAKWFDLDIEWPVPATIQISAISATRTQ